MKLRAKRIKDGFLIPLIEELKDKEEIEVEIKLEKTTPFLEFLEKIYSNVENFSLLTDEEALENALRDKYGL